MISPRRLSDAHIYALMGPPPSSRPSMLMTPRSHDFASRLATSCSFIATGLISTPPRAGPASTPPGFTTRAFSPLTLAGRRRTGRRHAATPSSFPPHDEFRGLRDAPRSFPCYPAVINASHAIRLLITPRAEFSLITITPALSRRSRYDIYGPCRRHRDILLYKCR